MRNILITGGAGFIGTNFVYYWLKNHPNDKITVLDALTYAGNLKNLAIANNFKNFNFIKGNILDQDLLSSIFSKREIDTVVHFAAESHVDRSILNPENFMNTNIMGTHTLLTTAMKFWKKSHNKNHFHHVSTDEVYGSLGPNDLPFTESSPYAPNSPYAASKASSNHLVRAYYRTYHFPMTISNCSNNYGPYQNIEKFIPTVIRSCLEWKPIPIYSNGSNIRDWIHVEDHCCAIEFILQKGQIGETYNIGGNNEVCNLELAQYICRIMDKIKPREKPYHSLISLVKDRPGHDWRYAVDTAKIKLQLGFSPKTQFEMGLINTIHYYLENIEETI